MSAKYSLIEQLALSGDSASSDYYMAHSHGGNILAYALNQRPDLARKIGGCVFLSTPFYVYRLLPSWRYLLDGLLLPLSLLIAFAISQLMHLLILGCAYLFAKWSGINVAWLYVPIITVTSFLCAIFVLARLNRWKRGVTWRLLARARYLRTSMSSGIPAGTNAIFIRSSGDEAAAALGFMQTVSWLLLALNVVVARILRAALTPFSITKITRAVGLITIVLALSLSWSIITTSRAHPLLPSDAKAATFAFYDFVFGVLFSIPTHDTFSLWVAAAIYAAFNISASIIAVIAAGSFAIAVIMFALNWLLTLPFGGLPIGLGGVLQVAVEATPPGEWNFIHTNWTHRRMQNRGLFWRHSDPYGNEQVIRVVAEWLRNSMTAKGE